MQGSRVRFCETPAECCVCAHRPPALLPSPRSFHCAYVPPREIQLRPPCLLMAYDGQLMTSAEPFAEFQSNSNSENRKAGSEGPVCGLSVQHLKLSH